MKKILSIILTVLMVLMTFVACSKESESGEIEKAPETTKKTVQATTHEPEETEPEVQDEDWGVTESLVPLKNGKMSNVYIKFPTLSGINRGSGKIAYQTDDSLVIFDKEKNSGSPAVPGDTVDNVFPAYFEQTIDVMDGYRNQDFDNFDFTVEEKESVEINGYEMCKYTGKHTYTYQDEPMEISYVAYATKLNANGAYVYWMVIDDSDDQSLTKTIEKHADKMATTLSE